MIVDSAEAEVISQQSTNFAARLTDGADESCVTGRRHVLQTAADS